MGFIEPESTTSRSGNLGVGPRRKAGQHRDQHGCGGADEGVARLDQAARQPDASSAPI